ncbi:MAG: DNA-binding protein WhiA [Candidatus Izimaplasma sp.]|nr:DNA-binding protein WhiA [Candidatus Izimaplasma bacterium]
MSFAGDVKSELLNVKLSDCCVLSELAALLRINGDLHITSEGLSVEFKSTNLSISRRVIAFIKRMYQIEVEVKRKKQTKLNQHDSIIVGIHDQSSKIVGELNLLEETTNILSDPLLVRECCKVSFLRGAFLASGSINSPKSSGYHFEIHTDRESDADNIVDLLNYFELNAKFLSRKKGFIAYIKEAERISDFLRLVGAHNALLSYEDERIKRDFVNSITRVMNMDIANQNKTLEAAAKHLRSISVLENMMEVEKLPKTLQEAIKLRKKYPESSLRELSEKSEDMFNKTISKSALNHRFRNIHELAEKIIRDLNE